MIPVRMQSRQAEQATAASASDIEVNGLFGSGEQFIRVWQPQWQLKEAAQGIDVLAQGSSGVS